MTTKDWQTRTELLIGEKGVSRLARAHVLLVGVGGVGAYAAEQLCRAGVGELTIVDADKVAPSNINRQLPALHSTVGQSKVEVMGRRLLDINPDLKLHTVEEFIRDDRTSELLDAAPYDCVLDAIDSLSPKVYLIYQTVQRAIPVVSVMGAGGKMDPHLVQIADIAKSHHCHLAKAVRKRLYRLGVKHGVEVVFSAENVPEDAVIIDQDEYAGRVRLLRCLRRHPTVVGSTAGMRLLVTALQVPRHGTTLRDFVACVDLPSSCPYGAAQGKSIV